jgi:inhibitor of cysteine peptidase
MWKKESALQAVSGVILVLAVLMSTILTGCSSAGDGMQLDGDDNGTQVALAKGQTVAITLASNPTTGYSWQVVPSDDGVLVQVGEAEFEENPRSKGLVGAGGAETLRFEAKRPGQTTLELAYRRPWEKNEKPIETFSVQVTVE